MERMSIKYFRNDALWKPIGIYLQLVLKRLLPILLISAKNILPDITLILKKGVF